MECCLFCDIVKGEKPCFCIWEDEKSMAFLSIYPNTEGFTVVVPKKHFSSYVFEAPQHVVDDLMKATKKVSKILESTLSVNRCAVIFEGYGVNHLHAKLIPLHGVPKEWCPIVKMINKFFPSYEGYVSSHDCERMSDEKLFKIWKKITA
jgi:diadenosine tetraphosphate (Ap4A) HIT family hydrolase